MLEGISWDILINQAAGPVALFDLHGQYWYVNPAFCRLLGYGREEVLRRGREQLTHPDDRVLNRQSIEEALTAENERASFEKRFVRSDSSVIWVLVYVSVVKDSAGRPDMFLSQIHDITDRREAELRWNRTFANAPIGMALLDLDGQWMEVNDALCALLGYTRDELLSMHLAELTYPDDDKQPGTMPTALRDGHQDSISVEERYRHKDGHPLWLLTRVHVVPAPDRQPDHLVGQYEEIGGKRMADAHLAHLALHDPLTGLANRALLSDRLEHELAELPHKGGALALLVVDVDGLKPINDHYGHTTGDQLLIAVADKLLNVLRPEDTAARFGGDEFVVVSHVDGPATAEALRDRVAHQLDTRIEACGKHIPLQASVGLAVTGAPGTPPEILLHSADLDMYTRKERRGTTEDDRQR